jgi:hypothetical protein
MKIHSTRETLETIKKKLKKDRMAYTRFGDGEIGIMDDWRDDANHIKTSELTNELREAFKIDDPDFMISIPLHSQEEGMEGNVFGRYSSYDKMKEAVHRYEPREREYYNPIALHYLSLFEPRIVVDFFKGLSKSLIVGGGHLQVLMDKFDADFIETPGRNAYLEIDKFFPDILKVIHTKKIDTVLLGAGACSTPIQKRLWEYPVKTINIGSVFDMMLGLKTRGWINESHQKINEFNEIFNNNSNI